MNPTVLITGTSSGLGKELVQHFAHHNWQVIATSRKPKGMWKDYENVSEKPLDVTNAASVTALFEELHLSASTIDLVINNAGRAVLGSLEDTTIDAVQQIFEVNVLGVIRMLQALVPYYRKRGKGRIINVSSLSGLAVDIPLASVYAMSKFALEGLTEGVFFELKALGIDIHLVEPGGFKSSLVDNAILFPTDKDPVYDSINANLSKVLTTKLTDPHSPHTAITDVVETIYKLAIGEINAFRNPVGSDTAEILQLRSNQTIDDYLDVIGSKFSID
ncbi:SDR family oxidoreductase [Siphonobacter sp. SORGH_AS_0500]|uniref:SDR family oxidoreductase n=1 Tax=Siphonobacter sp. SORGH_AS_0500 TaxID=1864824 RepID=UPI002859682C|nr:SDR family oxidoreductase [Siphonobacter sp. SORGH_AS_0500]MDR6193268.1 NAD(P)-dependent dehydrogenase (short-subunit alcohol dehydrogenase family) [Siphonobacter sp. SORGH_AS_0500]